MQIRRANTTDLDSLKTIYYETRMSLPWVDQSAIKMSDFERDTEGESIWVCENDFKVVGFVSSWVEDNFLHHLYVLSEQSGRGFGKHLLNVCINELTVPIRLKCNSKNQKALEFYRRQGWKTESKGIGEDGEYHLMGLTEHKQFNGTASPGVVGE